MIPSSRSLLILAWLAFLANPCLAQFSSAFLQNSSYWGDGKSEVNLYGIDLTMDGARYQAETLLIFTPLLLDPASLAPVGDPKQPGALSAIRMNASTTIPRGLMLDQHSTTALWRLDSMSLARLSFAGSDNIGDLFKLIEEKRNGDATTWKYSCETYHGHSDPTEIPAPKGTVLFRQELPLRVRTIDFSKPSGTFDVQLASLPGGPTCGAVAFKPAKISYQTGERAIAVEVKHEAGTDTFTLDRDFPFLLRDWKMAEGGSLKLHNSIKAAYQNYNKPGDRERALNDPRLRHPD